MKNILILLALTLSFGAFAQTVTTSTTTTTTTSTTTTINLDSLLDAKVQQMQPRQVVQPQPVVQQPTAPKEVQLTPDEVEESNQGNLNADDTTLRDSYPSNVDDTDDCGPMGIFFGCVLLSLCVIVPLFLFLEYGV